MPSPGFSLVGFLEEPAALNHLGFNCVPTNPDPAALRMEWEAARARLGNPFPNAGKPDIRDLPPEALPHIDTLRALPWVAEYLALVPGCSFRMVEIDALLAYQTTVDSARSDHHCHGLQNPPSLEEVLHCCLPLTPSDEVFQVQQGPYGYSVILRTKSLNIRTIAQGFFPQLNKNGILGLIVGWALKMIHVVRYNGRCYLHNGFHRALGLRSSGATHMPCVFRDVGLEAEVGANVGTLGFPLLESSDPPTVAHYTQGRAHPVQLRAVSKIIHASWAEHVVPDE